MDCSYFKSAVIREATVTNSTALVTGDMHECVTHELVGVHVSAHSPAPSQS